MPWYIKFFGSLTVGFLVGVSTQDFALGAAAYVATFVISPIPKDGW